MYRGNPIEGSNPSFSAIALKNHHFLKRDDQTCLWPRQIETIQHALDCRGQAATTKSRNSAIGPGPACSLHLRRSEAREGPFHAVGVTFTWPQYRRGEARFVDGVSETSSTGCWHDWQAVRLGTAFFHALICGMTATCCQNRTFFGMGQNAAR